MASIKDALTVISFRPERGHPKPDSLGISQQELISLLSVFQLLPFTLEDKIYPNNHDNQTGE
jgi:hypothetical protein